MIGPAVAGKAAAQTLTEPTSPPKPPAIATKPSPTPNARKCSAFGPGFVYVPGTDACVKIGGWIGVDTGGSR